MTLVLVAVPGAGGGNQRAAGGRRESGEATAAGDNTTSWPAIIGKCLGMLH